MEEEEEEGIEEEEEEEAESSTGFGSTLSSIRRIEEEGAGGEGSPAVFDIVMKSKTSGGSCRERKRINVAVNGDELAR